MDIITNIINDKKLVFKINEKEITIDFSDDRISPVQELFEDILNILLSGEENINIQYPKQIANEYYYNIATKYIDSLNNDIKNIKMDEKYIKIIEIRNNIIK